MAVKKRLWHKCFPLNLAKFVRTPFLQNNSGRLLLALAFQKQTPEVFYEKFHKIHRKTPLVCEIFKYTFFYRTALDDCFWLFRATLLKWGTANSVWKTSDEYSLSRNTNLRSTVQVYHFFFGRINFQCMSSLVYTVYCQKQPSEQRYSVKKGVLKDFVNFIGKLLCWSLFLIMFSN